MDTLASRRGGPAAGLQVRVPQAPRTHHNPSRLSGEGSLTREREALLGSGSGVYPPAEGEAPRIWWSLMACGGRSRLLHLGCRAVLYWWTVDQCAVCVRLQVLPLAPLVGALWVCWESVCGGHRSAELPSQP